MKKFSINLQMIRRSGIPIFIVGVLAFLIGRISTPTTGTRQQTEATLSAERKETVWTCSMHPQIKMNKPGKCPICFMDLIPLSDVKGNDDGGGETTRLSMSERAKALAGIMTAPAVRRGVTSDIRMTGKVAVDETRVEMITARIAGRIDRLYVDYTGVQVSTGDHLAEIYSPELVALQQELLQASKAVANLNANVSEMIRNSTKNMYSAAKEKLRLLGFSENELESILSRNAPSDHMLIRAGQRGVVLRKLVDEGAYVQTGSPLFKIGDLRKLWVILDAYESDLVWIRIGQKVVFMVEAFPGQQFDGTISFIDPVIDPHTRTARVRAVVDNSDGRLKPDMFVKADIKASLSKSGAVRNIALRGKWLCPMHSQVIKKGPGTCDICGMPLIKAEELGYVTSGFEDVEPLVIPATAPLFTGERSLVYVEISDAQEPTYEARSVVLGPRVGSYYIVRSGISEGEKVVVNGAFKIDGELQIRGKPSMMQPQEASGSEQQHALHPHEHSMNSGEEMPVMSDTPVSDGFLKMLNKVTASYLTVADELANDDLEASVKEFGVLRDLVAKAENVEGEQFKAWNVAKRTLKNELDYVRHIKEITDARSLFEKVSRQIISLEKQYLKDDGTDHFLAFCPMAFNNSGAYWVQKGDSIRNPYFGVKMLKCGEIKGKL
ncbi:MAG: efflux RND transporter periplasmic adaptor subunit [Chitinispirillaceae bacterium]|nr:efflux RND transporter periplasmic adaptor subunit [Chitinispirillaceae bacterium]